MKKGKKVIRINKTNTSYATEVRFGKKKTVVFKASSYAIEIPKSLPVQIFITSDLIEIIIFKQIDIFVKAQYLIIEKA